MSNKIKYETKISDGRCRGAGRNYRPWFQIHERDKSGIALRFRCKKTGRMHEIIGRNRINFFFDLVWDDDVTDIMENYVPMSREETAIFAEAHNLTPPKTGDNEFDVIVTDFLVIYRNGHQKAVDILKKGTLKNPSALIRHRVKKAYWESRGIPYITVDAKDLSQKRANLIQHLLQPLPESSSALRSDVLSVWLTLYTTTDKSIIDISRIMEKEYSLKEGDGVLPFWHLAANKKIHIDPDTVLSFSRKRGKKPVMPEWPFESKPYTSTDILENACFQRPDKTIWRIIYYQMSVSHIIEISDKVRMPKVIPTDELKLSVTKDIYHLLANDPFQKPDHVTAAMQKKQKLWEDEFSHHPVRTDMILDENIRRAEILLIAGDLNVSCDTVIRQLSRFWQSGFCSLALAGKSANSGQTHESHLNKQSMGGRTAIADNYINKILRQIDFEYMHDTIMDYYARPEKPTIPNTHKELLNRYYRDCNSPDGYSESYPSESQFARFLHTLPEEDKAIIEMKRLGRKGAPLKGRAYFGNLSEPYYGFGDCVMLDATELDIMLCYRYNTQEKIGRAVLYYGIDVATIQIAMVYLGIKSEGSYGARMLILFGLTDKVKLGQRFGVDITENDFPGSPYLPHCIVCDNSEMRGVFMDSFVQNLGVSVCNTLPNRGDLKSPVEKEFKESMLDIGKTKGHVSKEYKDNTGNNYVGESVFTIPDAWKLVLERVVEHNRHRAVPYRGRPDWIEEKVTPTPDNLARWCLKNSTGRLRRIDPALVNASMLPEATAQITPTGLYFNGLQYIPDDESNDSEFILARKHWKKRSKNNKPGTLKIHHDPTMVSIIYRIIPGVPKPIVYRLSNVDEAVFGRLSLIEVLFLMDIRKKQLAKQHQTDMVHKAKLKQQIRNTEKKAQEKVKKDRKLFGENGKISRHAKAVEMSLQVREDLTQFQHEQLSNYLLALLDSNPYLKDKLDQIKEPDPDELE